MTRKLATIVCLLALGLGVSGCSKCGFWWDQGSRSCHAEAPR
jgi:hypothetical protein